MPNSSFHTEATTVWNVEFFKKFVDLRNHIYEGEELFLKQSVEEIKKELTSPYFQKNGVQFKALMWFDSQTEIPFARVLCYFDPNAPDVVSFGHFELKSEYRHFSISIQKEIETFTAENEVRAYRGPMQGNFFFSYRAKVSGSGHFYSEPYHQSFYPEIYEQWGMDVKKRWTSSALDKSMTIKNFTQIRKSSQKKNKSLRKIRVRFIFPWRWERSMKTIYDLFMRSYKDMSDFTPIDYETFQLHYDDFKYIINPFFSYIIECEGEPVGFGINFFDPQEILARYQKRCQSRILKRSKVLSTIHDLVLLIRLKLNFKRLLIMYVGKVKTSDGKEVKGVQSLISKYLAIFSTLVGMKEAYVCYTAEDSPANSSFRQPAKTQVSEYALFQKTLS